MGVVIASFWRSRFREVAAIKESRAMCHFKTDVRFQFWDGQILCVKSEYDHVAVRNLSRVQHL